jgi:phospholipid-binding lipoprotein MlaA
MNSINEQHHQQLYLILLLWTGLMFMEATILPHPLRAQDGGISDMSFGNNDDFTVDDDWDAYEEQAVYDPYEKYNRAMFNFNSKVYRHLFTPLAKGYDFLVPKKIQGSFNNVVRFAGTPKRFFNSLFQKKFKSSFIEFRRLVINASVGIGGLFDPADRVFGLSQQTEDFGQTLGHYGVDAGPYIIWPIVGPSTRRDAIGLIGDTAFDVFFWFGIYDVESQTAFRAFGAVKRVNNYSYNVRKNYERITDSAIDPYIALQHAYIQNREKDIRE